LLFLNPNIPIQLISCTIACTGFALWFKIKGIQVLYSGIGAFFSWAVYLLVYHYYPSNFAATLISAIFVAEYAFIMSRVNKAPATIFLTACVFPLIPGPNLYYMMYGLVDKDMEFAIEHTVVLIVTCLGIAFGYIIVDIFNKYLFMFIDIMKNKKKINKI